MNSNNNAVTVQNLIQPVNSSLTMLQSVGSNQEKDQGIATFSNLVPVHVNEQTVPSIGENGFPRGAIASAAPLPSTTFAEFQNGSPPIFRSNPQRPFHSPSRSFSMPATSRAITYGQFNVAHVPQVSLFSAHPTYGSGARLQLQHGTTAPERYSLINSHSSHTMPRFQGTLARCPGNSLSSYRAPYGTTILPGATSGAIRGNNPSPEKEQKEASNTRKKRKACGHCEPCRRKENCGSCMNCINRAKGKQICVHRKCEVLKKKPNSTSSYIASSDPIQEKRKDFEGGILPKQAKRSKSNDNSNDHIPIISRSILRPNYSNFSAVSPSLVPQSFNNRTIPCVRSDLPTSSDNYSSFLVPASSPANTFEQVNSQHSNPTNANISIPVEASDFIDQTIHEIESNMQKCEQNSPKSDDNFSQLHELQPTVQLAPNSNFSWNATDLPGKLLKSLTSETNPLLSTQLAVTHDLDQISKSESLLESFTVSDAQATTNSNSLAPQNSSIHDSQTLLSQEQSQSARLVAENPVQFQQLVPSGSQIQKSNFPQYEQPLHNQLSNPPLLPSTTLSNPSSLFNTNVSPNSSHLVHQVSERSGDFNQLESESDLCSLQNLDTWNFDPRPMQNIHSFTAAQTDAVQQVASNRPPSNNQDSTSFPTRKISTNSADSFHLQRHLSVGSRGSNQSPMTQASPGAGSATLHQGIMGSHSNLKSPIAAMPSNSPAPSHLSSMMGSPASSMHISPAQSQSPFTSGLTNISAPLSDREIQQNSPSLWAEQLTSDPNLMPNCNYRVAHSVALSGNFAQKPSTAMLGPKPVPNRFLVEPGSSLKNMPCSESTALQNNTSCSLSCVSASAVRSSQSENHFNDGGTGHMREPPPNSVGQHKVFAQTMNEVLYGGFTHDKSTQHCGSDTKVKIEMPVFRGTSSIESPTDTHPTISPGESGYDSNEPGSVASDTLSQQSLPHGGSDVLSASESTIISTQAKNAQAALAGSKYQRTFSFENCQSTQETMHLYSDGSNARWLPAKAASVQAQCLNVQEATKSNLPQDDSAFCSNREVNCNPAVANHTYTLNRSLSVDSGHPDKPDSTEFYSTANARKVLPLRRYSFQGLEANKKVERIETSPDKLFSAPFFPYAPTSCAARDKKSVSANTVPAPVPVYSAAAVAKRSSSVDACRSSLASYPFYHRPYLRELKNKKLTSDDLRGRVISYAAANGNILKKTVFPECQCLEGTDIGDDDAPYYTHLGTASDVKGIRKLFEERTGFVGNALRIERVYYTGKEGKTSRGCPIAKWIIRRASAEEKVLIICRHRPGHRCAAAVIVIMIMLWEGIDRQLADDTYEKCTKLIPTNGAATERRCGTNDERTCACQGFNEDKGGASFSFGCSWSMYYNGCKYARSTNPNKFKLSGTNDRDAEASVEDFCQRLATIVGSVYKKTAPDAHRNQTEHEHHGFECRLGYDAANEGRPFSGVTCCMDFCAHSHKDKHNMDNGTTVVVTLTKPENREIGRKPPDEQFHVLPLYRWDPCSEDGTLNGIGKKLKSGAIEILSGFRRAVRIRDKPLGTCKQRKERKKRADLTALITPPKRKRGRKVKRSFSMENVTDIGKETLMDQSQNGFDALGRDFSHWRPAQQPLSNRTDLAHNSIHHPLQTLPPRWPYRRHTSAVYEIDSFYTATQSNLPSIGSIFDSSAMAPLESTAGSIVPNQAIGSPQSSFQFGSRLSSTSPSPSPLPSLMSDCHSSFSSSQLEMSHLPSRVAIKTEPQSHPYSLYYEPPEEHHVELKTYARLTSRKEIKQEPVDTGVPTPNVKAKMNSFLLETSPPVEHEVFSDSSESFHDPNIGGVAVAPAHGSILIECAKRELHATTSLLKPDRFRPSRISLVFYQHKNMNYRNHGAAEYVAKEAKRIQEKAEKQEAAEKTEFEMQENIRKQRETLKHQINPHVLHQNTAQLLPRTPETTVEITSDYPANHCNYSLQQEFGMRVGTVRPSQLAAPFQQGMVPPNPTRPAANISLGPYGSHRFAFRANNSHSSLVPGSWTMLSAGAHSPCSVSLGERSFGSDVSTTRSDTHRHIFPNSSSPFEQQQRVVPEQRLSLSASLNSSSSDSPKKLFTVL